MSIKVSHQLKFYMLTVVLLFNYNSFSEESTSTIFSPGDGIMISIYPPEEAEITFISGVYEIDHNREIHLPIIGQFSLPGRSLSDIEDVIKKELIDYLPYPNVSALLVKRIIFQGGFRSPGLYWINPEKSVWSALRISGGTNRKDGLQKVEMHRNDSIIFNNLMPYIENGSSLNNIGFQSGDQFVVTTRQKSDFWDILFGKILPITSFTLSMAITVLSLKTTLE